MKTNAISLPLILALIISPITSCEKIDTTFFGRTGTDSILMGKISTTEPATRAAEDITTSRIELENGSEFTITRTDEPYTETAVTKANEKKADNLSSFTLYGHLDATDIANAPAASDEDKNDTFFIKGANVIKGDDGLWHTDSPYFWRNGITHYFWAQSGIESMSTSDGSASFTKGDSSDEDILVAFASKKWTEDMCNDHNGDNLDINFKHATSAMTFNFGKIEFKQKDEDGNRTALDDPSRISMGAINLIAMNEGKCTVSKDLAISWSDVKQYGAKAILAGETHFTIPQKGAALQIMYTDNLRTETKPVIIPLDGIAPPGDYSLPEQWEAGRLYNYTIEGSVSVPKVNGQITPGINLDFHQKESRGEIVATEIDVTYYKQIKVTWDNLPNATGNGTFAIVYFRKKGEDTPKDLKNIKDNNVSTYVQDPEIIFIYDAFSKKVDKPVGGTVDQKHCTCYMDIPDDMKGTVNLYFAYTGGSNNQATLWTVENLNFEVTAYK